MHRQGLEFDDLLRWISAEWPCICTFARSGVSVETRNRNSKFGQLRLLQPLLLKVNPPGSESDLMKSMPLLKRIELRVEDLLFEK